MKIDIPKGISTLLFDLGGVLIDLHLKNCYEAFKKLGFQNFEHHFDSYMGSAFIQDFEEGKISNASFLDILKQQCNTEVSNNQILSAWNAMLGDVPLHKFELLQKWQQQYKIYLYSNTNDLHVKHLNQYYNEQFGENAFQNCFTKMYFSNELGIRKPKKAGYLKIMELENLQPHEIFYIEDGNMHIETAKSVGIKCLLWEKNEPFI